MNAFSPQFNFPSAAAGQFLHADVCRPSLFSLLFSCHDLVKRLEPSLITCHRSMHAIVGLSRDVDLPHNVTMIFR